MSRVNELVGSVIGLLLRYSAAGHCRGGRPFELPEGPIARAMFDEALVAMADHQGINADILRRWHAKAPLSARDS